jgi:DNA-directed RNA polymerase specialized sigma24 family protein
LKDIEQELWLKLLAHSASYDFRRGHRYAFIATVLKRHAANLLRHQCAEKRNDRHVGALDVVVAEEDGESIELGDTISRRELNARIGYSARDEHETRQLALDTADVLATLPAELRILAESLKTQNITEIARKTGVPRTTLNDRVGQLRRRFELAGMRLYLENVSSHRIGNA